MHYVREKNTEALKKEKKHRRLGGGGWPKKNFLLWGQVKKDIFGVKEKDHHDTALLRTNINEKRQINRIGPSSHRFTSI